MNATKKDQISRLRQWPTWLVRLVLASLTALSLSAGGLINVPRLDLAASDGAVLPTGWTPRPPLQVARIGLDVAKVSGEILAIGGFDPGQPEVFASVEARKITGGSPWRTIAPLPTARANAAAAELGGAVYVAGGFSDDATLDTVERFDPVSGSWSPSTRLPAPRGAAAAAALGGLVYVAGGLTPVSPTDDEITDSVVAFNPQTKTWAPVAPMLTARWRLRLVATGGSLYAIGGQSRAGDTLSVVERYDPLGNRWTTVAPMTEDRGVPGVVAVDRGAEHLIVAVGGCQFVNGRLVSLLRSAEAYNLGTGQWQRLRAQLPYGTCSLGSAVEVDGTVLAIGGVADIDGSITASADVNALTL